MFRKLSDIIQLHDREYSHTSSNTLPVSGLKYANTEQHHINQLVSIKNPNIFIDNTLHRSTLNNITKNNTNEDTTNHTLELSDYKKRYFDIYLAKKKLLDDKCKEATDNKNNTFDISLPLANSLISTNYITSNSDVKIYNRIANPPLSLNTFTQGSISADVVLKPTPIFNNQKYMQTNITSNLYHSNSGTKYNFYNEEPDSTSAPFNMHYLEQLFIKMGGQSTGLAYPNMKNMLIYNSMTNLGNIKQYFNKLVNDTRSSDYNTQKLATMQLLGIAPQKLIIRVPYNQGVEVIWFQPISKGTHCIGGILKRSVETDIVQINGLTTSMLQLFDVRASNNLNMKYNITTDGRFFIAINQPDTVAKVAFDYINTDQDGLLANLDISSHQTDPILYIPKHDYNYFGNIPNIVKIFYSAHNSHTFQVSTNNQTITPRHYSLTLEPRAPFLNFELNQLGDTFDDTRNPGLFTNLITQSALEFHNRPEQRHNTPGKKGFIRLVNTSSYLSFTNIAYQAWGTVTFAFRLQTMPIKDGIFSFWVYNKFCILYLVPINGSTAQMRVKSNIGKNDDAYDNATNFNISIGEWYFMNVSLSDENKVFDIQCDSINNIIKNRNYTTRAIKLINMKPITTNINNGLYLPNQYNCNITIGGKGVNLAGTLQFDLAWIHFFDYIVAIHDIIKDCTASWQFTQFPDSSNTYRISS